MPNTLERALEKLLEQETAGGLPEYEPQPKQAAAEKLTDEAFELLFGGAAGGGKSYWMRASAAMFCLTHPGAHVAIVRRTRPMLRQTHMAWLTAALADKATLNRTDLTWTFPNDSVLRLISLPHVGDEQNYKSVEFDRLYFDELTEFHHDQYTYMLSRLRSSSAKECRACNRKRGHRVAAIAASNPEGVGFAWVKRRFVKPRPEDLRKGQTPPKPGEVWNPPLPDRSGRGPARAYLPSTVYDNHALIESDPEYIQRLEALPDPRKRKALLHGDWDAMDQIPGALWSLTELDTERVSAAPDNLARVVIGYDPATTFNDNSDETGIVAAGSVPGNPTQIYVLGDASGRFDGPEEAAKACAELAIQTEADAIVYETNQGGRYVRAVLLPAFEEAQRSGRLTGPLPRFIGVHAYRGKSVRAEPVAAEYRRGNVHHVGTFGELEEQLTTWAPGHPTSPDRLDALVYAVTNLSSSARSSQSNIQPFSY